MYVRRCIGLFWGQSYEFRSNIEHIHRFRFMAPCDVNEPISKSWQNVRWNVSRVRSAAEKALTKCLVCGGGWAEFKCVIHHVLFTQQRHTGQFAGTQSFTNTHWYCKNCTLGRLVCFNSPKMISSAATSKYTQMGLTNIVTCHNLLKCFKSSGKGDFKEVHSDWIVFRMWFAIRPMVN